MPTEFTQEQPKDYTLYYFGCWDQAGHYWFRPDGSGPRGVGPFGDWLDGYYPPATGGRHHDSVSHPYQDETLAALFHTRGWTVLSMWDRSVDSRYACNATFVKEGKFTHDEMWEFVKLSYPQIYARLKAAPK
jgi:hypothetical protein